MKYKRLFTKGLSVLLIGITVFLGGCSKTPAVSVDKMHELETNTEIPEIIDETETYTSEYTTEEENIEGIDELSEENINKKRCEPVKAKGIYVSGPVAGTQKMDDLINLIEETELNSMVIDVKNDDGNVTYKMDCPAVSEIDAGIGYIRDINELVKKCKEKDIYLIARVVAFKDPYLAEKCPEYAIKQKDGGIFRDKKGLAWVNPYNKEVWKYLLEIAKQAALDGFDEVQFDYIRFSTEIDDSKVDYGVEAVDVSKTDIILEFTQYINDELSKEGVYVAADVYGTIIDSAVDQKIVGQKYVDMAANLDYICPMVYPSHYGNGVYGIRVPDAEPYKTIKNAMDAATIELSVLEGEHCAINRVWLQGFTASWVKGHISYGKQQIRDQIRGAYEAGYDEWIIWNASVKYPREWFLTDDEAEKEASGWMIQKAQVVKEEELSTQAVDSTEEKSSAE